MDFTQGSILKKLVKFMVPILGALILQAAYGAADILIVGKFGTTSGISAPAATVFGITINLIYYAHFRKTITVTD